MGGSVYLNPKFIIRNTTTREDVIWINRDVENNMLLNIDLNVLLDGRYQRLKMLDNIWLLHGNPNSFRCPPSGKEIFASYENGDTLWIRFEEITEIEKLQSITRMVLTEESLGKILPLTLVRIDLNLVERKLKTSSADGFEYDGRSIGPGFQFDLRNGQAVLLGIPGIKK